MTLIKQPIIKAPAVKSRGLSRSNRSDSNFGWSVWVESADPAVCSNNSLPISRYIAKVFTKAGGKEWRIQ